MSRPVPTPAPHDASLSNVVRQFYALTKPRVMSLVIFTGLCGLLAAPGYIHPLIGFTAVLCIAMGAGGAAARNRPEGSRMMVGRREGKIELAQLNEFIKSAHFVK